MLRKIMFLVPTFALALLPVSRLGGLAGKIGADGLAWAQDSPTADDGSSDDAAAQDSPDKSSANKFNGSGTFDATTVMPCSARSVLFACRPGHSNERERARDGRCCGRCRARQL